MSTPMEGTGFSASSTTLPSLAVVMLSRPDRVRVSFLHGFDIVSKRFICGEEKNAGCAEDKVNKS